MHVRMQLCGILFFRIRWIFYTKKGVYEKSWIGSNKLFFLASTLSRERAISMLIVAAKHLWVARICHNYKKKKTRNKINVHVPLIWRRINLKMERKSFSSLLAVRGLNFFFLPWGGNKIPWGLLKGLLGKNRLWFLVVNYYTHKNCFTFQVSYYSSDLAPLS